VSGGGFAGKTPETPTFIDKFIKSLTPGAGTGTAVAGAAVITPPKVTIPKGAEITTPTVTVKPTEGGPATGVIGIRGGSFEPPKPVILPEKAVTVMIPDIQLSTTPGVLDRPFNFKSVDTKNVDVVNNYLDTMNEYTKSGKPLTQNQMIQLESGINELTRAKVSPSDTTQIETYVKNYQIFATESQKVQNNFNEISKGNLGFIEPTARSVSNLSKFNVDAAEKYKSGLTDLVKINQVKQVVESKDAGKNWGKSIEIAKNIAGGISDPTLKAQFMKYPDEVRTIDVSTKAINAVATSATPIKESDKPGMIRNFNENIDKVTVIESSKKEELKTKYAAALELPGIYNDFNTIVSKAPEKGISDKDLANIRDKAYSNPLLSEVNPETNRTYGADIVNQAIKVKEGYITPEEFYRTVPILGTLAYYSTVQSPIPSQKPQASVVGMGAYGAYDVYKGFTEFGRGLKSQVTGKPIEGETIPALTAETPTIGHNLETGEKVVSGYLYTPITKGDISIGGVYGYGIDKLLEGVSVVPASVSERVIKPVLTEEQRGRLDVVGQTGSDFTRGLLMSPVEKPIETLVSVGVGKVFSVAMPVLEAGAARVAVGAGERIGVKAGTSTAITKYGVMAGLGAPYAFSVGERVISSERPGYTLGQIVGSEILPMGIGAGLGKEKVRVAGERTIGESGKMKFGGEPVAIGEGGRISFEGTKPLTMLDVKTGRMVPYEEGPKAPTSPTGGKVSDKGKIIVSGGKTAPSISKPVGAKPSRGVTDYLGDYLVKQKIISGKPTFIPFIEGAIGDLGAAIRGQDMSKVKFTKAPSATFEAKWLKEHGVKPEEVTKSQRADMKYQEDYANYISDYRQRMINQATEKTGVSKTDPEFLKEVDKAVEREVERIKELPRVVREDTVKMAAVVPKATSGTIDTMIGSQKDLMRDIQKLQSKQGIVPEQLSLDQLREMRYREDLSSYLSDYKDRMVNEAVSKGIKTDDPDLIKMINENLKFEQSRLKRLPLYERERVVSRSNVPPTTTEGIIPSMERSDRGLQKKGVIERPEEFTASQLREMRYREDLTQYISDYKERMINQATDKTGVSKTDPEFLKEVDKAVEREQTRLKKLPLMEREDIVRRLIITSKPQEGIIKSMERSDRGLQKKGVIERPEEFTPNQLREMRYREDLTQYISDYKERMINQATDKTGVSKTDPEFLKEVDKAVEREQTRLKKLPLMEREDIVRRPSTSVISKKGLSTPEKGSARGIDLQLKNIQDKIFNKEVRETTSSELSPDQLREMKSKEGLAEYLNIYRDKTTIKLIESGIKSDSPELTKLLNEAVNREQVRLKQLSPFERDSFIKSENEGASKRLTSAERLKRDMYEEQLHQNAIDKVLLLIEESAKKDGREFNKFETYNEIQGRTLRELNVLETNLKTTLYPEGVKPIIKTEMVKELTPEQKLDQALYEEKLHQTAVDRVLRLMQEEAKRSNREFDKSSVYNDIQTKTLKELRMLEVNLRTTLYQKVSATPTIKSEPVKELTVEEKQARALYEDQLRNTAIDKVLTLMKESAKKDGREFDRSVVYNEINNKSFKELTALENNLRTTLYPPEKLKATEYILGKRGEKGSTIFKFEKVEGKGKAGTTTGKTKFPSGMGGIEYPTGMGGIKYPTGFGLEYPSGKIGKPVDKISGTGKSKPSSTAGKRSLTKISETTQASVKKPIDIIDITKLEEQISARESPQDRGVMELIATDKYLKIYQDQLLQHAKSQGLDINDPAVIKSISDALNTERESLKNKSPNKRAELLGLPREPGRIAGSSMLTTTSNIKLTPSEIFDVGRAAKRSGAIPEVKKVSKTKPVSGGIESGRGGQALIVKTEQKVKVEQKPEVKVEQKSEVKVEQKPEVRSKLKEGLPLIRKKYIEEFSPYERTWTQSEVESRQVSKVEPVTKSAVGVGLSNLFGATSIGSQVSSILAQAQKQSPEELVRPTVRQAQPQINIIKSGQRQFTGQPQVSAQASTQESVQTPAQKSAQRSMQRFAQVLAQAPVSVVAQKSAQVQAKVQAKAQVEKLIELERVKPKPFLLPPMGKREPWGGDPFPRERLGARRIFQPIATGMQLLTGKGLFDIKYSVKTPWKVATGTGKTINKNSPSQISSQLTGKRMGLGVTKSPRPTVGEETVVGKNVGKMLKGIANPALRIAVKKKIKAKRKR
jgi:hypothetical protein